MDKYDIKIIGDKVFAVKNTLLYGGNIVDFKTAKEGITEITIEESGVFGSQIKVSPDRVFYNVRDALVFQGDTCKEEMKRLKAEYNLVESYSMKANKRLVELM